MKTELIDLGDNYFSFSIEEDNNKVSLFLEKLNNIFILKSFISGKIGKTSYRKSDFNDKIYTKEGRGKESKVSKEKIKDLYSKAIEEYMKL